MIDKRSRTRTHDDLLDAFREEGCPVCRLALRDVRGYLRAISVEGGITDPEIRLRLRASHAFCNEHAYLWLEQRHLLGTAVIYDDVLTHLGEELRGLRFEQRGLLRGVSSLLHLGGGRDGGRELEELAAHEECPACRALALSEEMGIDVLLEGLGRPEFGEAYGASGGLCLPHLRTALIAARDEETFGALIAAAAARHDALHAQLREIIRKHDYRYSHEPVGEERGADERAVRHAVGERGIDASGVAGRRARGASEKAKGES